MEFFHTVLLSLCFIKGCDLIVRAEQPSEIDTMHHLTSGSLSAQRGSILLLLKKMRKYITVCAWKCCFLLPSTRWFDTECRKLLLWIISISFFFFKDFTSIVIHHLILLISSAVKCMQTVKALEYEQKALWAAVGVWKKKSKPPFFVMQSYHHRVSLLSPACLDFIDYQLLWWHYWFFFLYTDCVLASVFPAVFFVFRLLQPQPMNWSILPA